MALTIDEEERMWIAIENAQHNFAPGPGKRIAQMAMEKCLELRGKFEEQRGACMRQQALAEYYAQHPWRHLWKALKRSWARQRLWWAR